MTLDALPKIRSPRVQVEQGIAQLIKTMQPGEQLPTEPALAKRLGVSRATLRAVLQMYAERGILIRRHGIGTFVASRLPVLETGLEVLESLDRMTERMGLETCIKHANITERHATQAELKGLGRKVDTRVLVVNRVFCVEEQPVADLRDIVPVEYLREADLHDTFRGSILDLLLQDDGLMLTTSRTDLLAENANAQLAERLNIDVGTALLRLTAQLFSFDEHIVDYSVSYFIPGYFKLHVMRQVRQNTHP